MGEITRLTYPVGTAPFGPLDIYISGHENAASIDTVTLQVMAGSIANMAWRESQWFKDENKARDKNEIRLGIALDASVNTQMSYSTRWAEAPYFHSAIAVRPNAKMRINDIDHDSVIGGASAGSAHDPVSFFQDFKNIFSKKPDLAHEYRITDVSVRPEAQGRGIGSALLYALLNTYHKTGEQPVAICPKANLRGLAKLQRLGFIAGDSYVNRQLINENEALVVTRFTASNAEAVQARLLEANPWIANGSYVSTELIPTEVFHPVVKSGAEAKQ